jgi:pyridoxal phosphate enzyme (YggS family)
VTVTVSVIKDNVEKLLASLPPAVTLMAVVKTRSPGEVTEAVDAGVRVIGGNYVQETASLLDAIGRRASCHLIGHLQRNKAGKAAELFDCIETVDSIEIAAEIDRRCSRTGKIMPVLIEVNSGREPNKSGVMPEDAESLAASVAGLNHVKIRGLMTMGPFFGDPEESRPCFRETKRIFDLLSSAGLSNVEMSVLSMGMSHSYRVAVEEGATLVRIGTGIFGERK